ncbi:MAG: hypothetical protein HYS04_16220 [Acidobacteria bacterium]|nr:hypothetical protein [Acidobacteriota bacterium]
MHAHARAQFAEEVFPRGARHDLTNRKVLPLRVFSVEEGGSDEDFIGHFDIDGGAIERSHFVLLSWTTMYTKTTLMSMASRANTEA